MHISFSYKLCSTCIYFIRLKWCHVYNQTGLLNLLLNNRITCIRILFIFSSCMWTMLCLYCWQICQIVLDVIKHSACILTVVCRRTFEGLFNVKWRICCSCQTTWMCPKVRHHQTSFLQLSNVYTLHATGRFFSLFEGLLDCLLIYM